MSIRKIVVILFALTPLASCDPRVFNELSDNTWVHTGGKPGSLNANGFGIGMVGASDGSGELHYLVAARDPASVVMNTFDRSGDRSTVVAELSKTVPDVQGLEVPVAMASDPGAFAAGTTGNVAVAAFSESSPLLIMVNGQDMDASTAFTLVGNNVATGIAFGPSDASEATDLVAIAGTDLNLIGDYQSQNTSRSCGLAAAGADVLIAEVDPNVSGAEVLVSSSGVVSVTSGSLLTEAIDNGESCFLNTPPLGTITAPGGESSFGQVLRSGDLDGNGSVDLVIAAPLENVVYTFMNWTVGAPTTGEKLVADEMVAFGFNVVTGDFNGDGRDELVISDHARNVDDVEEAGTVYLYSVEDNGSWADPVELHDAHPEKTQNFGQNLAVAKAFGGENLIVGANNEIFTYFRTPIAGDDDFRD